MEIELTKEQYENLIKLVYLGNWLINGIRTNDKLINKYEDMEQYIFSYFKKFDLERYIKFDEKAKKFLPAKELEDDPELVQYIDEYDEDVFWDEIICRLEARRDFVRKYGKRTILEMSHKERFEKEQPFIDKYA